jgi:RNA polymerase sigma factor (sigma-70 family)
MKSNRYVGTAKTHCPAASNSDTRVKQGCPPACECQLAIPKPLAENVRRKLDGADWSSIYPRLVLAAKSFARALYWRSGNNTDLAKGLTAEDLVNEAIKRVYERKREWDPEKDHDLFKYLKDSVLSSLFNELAESADNTLVKRFSYQTTGDEREGSDEEADKQAPAHADHAQHIKREIATPQDIAIAHEDEEKREGLAKEVIASLLSLANDDPEVTAILTCTLEGTTTPRQIAQEAGIAVDKIYNAQKRLRLMMKKVREEYGMDRPTRARSV